RSYPYYDPRTRGLDFSGMRNALDRLPAGAIVVLHACCHNPTGIDLSPEHWSEILAIVQRRGLIPFLDLAYQGFGDGLDADARAARARDPDQATRARRRSRFYPHAARPVLLLGPHQGTGAAAAQGVFDLRHRDRAHLRRRAQLRERQVRR